MEKKYKELGTNGEKITPHATTLIEISWEICNKVGGIHTVISSKAKKTKETYPEYICIGPYIKEQAKQEFQEQETPEKFKDAFNKIEQKGIKLRYGEWMIKGQPKTILIDFANLYEKKNDLKAELWNTNQIDSINAGWDFEEPMLFSYAATKLIQELEQQNLLNKTVLQAHEWMTGFTILFLKNRNTKIATTFTTHATILGRSIAGNNQDLYKTLNEIKPSNKAKELGIIEKHTTEKASANKADVFTTVSEITARETEHILDKKPDILTLNGLDTELFPSMEEAAIKHKKTREEIREFLEYMFFPYYTFETENNIMLYISGRYEYQNKGIDIFIDALNMLNDYLKENNSKKTVTALFLLATNNNGVKKEILEQKNYYKHLREYIQQNYKNFSRKLIKNIMDNQELQTEKLFTEEFKQELKKESKKFKKQGNPPICTHNINEEQDPIIQKLKETKLTNKEEDKVKVILFPAYLNGADGLFNKEYYELITGTHMGIFPSYYEPWGYTPLESAALAIPTITTDIGGFGRFIQEHEEEEKGIYIIRRDFQQKQKSIQEIYEVLKEYTNYNHSERVEHKIIAKKLSSLADWKDLINNYIEAHNYALKRTQPN